MNRRELMDEDGENLAVRTFLQLYGTNRGVEVGRMREHMRMSGWGDCWPDWVYDAFDSEHLTKGGAQSWLRYLFALEGSADQTGGAE